MKAKTVTEETTPTAGADLLDDIVTEPTAPVVYDRNAVQTVPMEVTRGDKIYNAALVMNPITDADFFRLHDALEQQVKGATSLSLDLLKPKADLGRRLAIQRIGFKERADWKEIMADEYFINAVQGLMIASPNVQGIAADDLIDDEEEIGIGLRVTFDGHEIETRFFFREQTKEETNEFLAIQDGAPQKNVLASAKRVSRQRRLHALYEKLIVRVENYERDDVPAFHAVEAVQWFLKGQLARLGKSSLG